MTRNPESVGRHGSVESSWSSRSGDTIRPYGRQGSLRGTPVTVRTTKDMKPYV
jgi:adenylate cyclase